MDQKIPAYDFKTLVHFRKLIEEQLVGIKLSEKHNHESEPKFLEDLKDWEKTGERGTELEKHFLSSGQSKENKDDLENALERLDNGTYGFCEWPGCDEVIPFDRLEAIPQAKYCLRHQMEVSKRKAMIASLKRISIKRH